MRVLALRSGIAYTTRCSITGERHPRVTNYRIPVEDMTHGFARGSGASYTLMQSEISQ